MISTKTAFVLQVLDSVMFGLDWLASKAPGSGVSLIYFKHPVKDNGLDLLKKIYLLI